MYSEFRDRLAAKLALDEPIQREAVCWAVDELVKRGYDPMTAEPTELAELVAADIAAYLHFEKQPLGRGRTRDWEVGWPGRVLVAISEAQRLCTGET